MPQVPYAPATTSLNKHEDRSLQDRHPQQVCSTPPTVCCQVRLHVPTPQLREPMDGSQASLRSLQVQSGTHGSSPGSHYDPKTLYCRPPNTGQDLPSYINGRP